MFQVIDIHFETIFEKKYNSNLYEFYNWIYYEIKDIKERNKKTISCIVNKFQHNFSIFSEMAEPRFVYFLNSTYLIKHLGFLKADEDYYRFIVNHILKNMRFGVQSFTLIDDVYEILINEFIYKCIRNIRYEIGNNNNGLLDGKEILKDINKLERLKLEGKFEFLNEHINSLRLLKTDIDSLYVNTKQSLIEIPLQNDFENIEKKDIKLKIEILFSPTKFRNLLIVFFKNAGIEMDEDKKNRINRFILNVIKFDSKKYNKYNSSPSETTINFFNNEKTTILKFCALIIFLERKNKIKKISNSLLQKILLAELEEINLPEIGISLNLRNVIGTNIRGKKIEKSEIELATIAGFKDTIEIISIIN